MKKNFKVTREQLETMIEALCKAECWKMEMMNRHPEHRKIYERDFNDFRELEFTFRDMIGKPIA